jgi:hypothetical protein
MVLTAAYKYPLCVFFIHYSGINYIVTVLTVALCSCWSYTTKGTEKDVPTAAFAVSTPHSRRLLPAKR